MNTASTGSDWLDQINTKVAHSMVKWLLDSKLDTNKPLNSFGLHTWKGLAAEAWSTYIGELSQVDRTQATPEQNAQLELWLG